MDEQTARERLVAAARRLDELGLNHNSSGNASIRVGDGLLVTPSGIPAEDITPADVVHLSLDGLPVRDGQRTPTSEWQLHVDIARHRPEVAGIVHTHSVEATAAATLGSSLPPIHYVAARFGSPGLPCAPYATYGTPALAGNVVDTLGDDGMACLMASHGAIALGGDIDAALALALDVEWFCGVLRRSLQHGDPVTLDDEEIERVATMFRTYGQPYA